MSSAKIGCAIFLAGCVGTGGIARHQFVQDHGCDPSVVVARPDLLPAGSTAPSLQRSGEEAWEMRGCGVHTLYRCESAGYSGETLLPTTCAQTIWCETPGCATDYAARAREAFATQKSCPVDRVRAVVATDSIAPPDDIAADAERVKLWRARLRAELDHESQVGALVLVRGCDATAVIDCTNHAPGAPTCAPRIVDDGLLR